MPKLSIIIPCYNAEKTLEQTLISILNQTYQNWEAIIVNDGSTDNTEVIALNYIFKDQRIKYFSKSNEGLGRTRNFGIEKAVGEYVLPLDADNLVEPDFAENAVKILRARKEVGVVHGNAEYFGERTGIWKMSTFNLEKIVVDNYIDACAIYRKELWTKVGGYDEDMPYQGHEDWEFWIALGMVNVTFYHLNTITFKYFVSSTSMIHSFTNQMATSNRDYIVKKYSEYFYEKYCEKTTLLAKVQEQNNINLQSEKFIINCLTKKIIGFEFFKIKGN